MNSQEQFAAFEFMCRARAALASKEMEYWLAEAEEWKQLRELPDLSYKEGSYRTPVSANPITDKITAVRISLTGWFPWLVNERHQRLKLRSMT